MVWKLVQSAGLAALLLPFGTVALESASITCGFGGYSSGSYSNCDTLGSSSGFYEAFFDFGDYQVRLEFEDVNGEFEVTVEDFLNPDLTGRLDDFDGHQCVPLDGTNCVEFEVTAPDPGETTWEGFYNIFISWFFNTESLGYTNTPGERIRMLHNRSDTPGDAFDTDITIPGSYVGPPIIDFLSIDDPAIGGRDDNFQTFIVTQAPNPVPEPATLALLGSGFGALLYHRRRRRATGAAPRS
jgi:hypothetical protein